MKNNNLLDKNVKNLNLLKVFLIIFLNTIIFYTNSVIGQLS